MLRPTARLCRRLQYEDSPGYFQEDAFAAADGSVYALSHAAEGAGVKASFGVFERSPADTGARRYVPLVYIAEADNEVAAEAIHRWVWSQSVVPFLLIVTPVCVFLCNGFRYGGRGNWRSTVSEVDLNLIESTDEPLPLAFRDLMAPRLLSSISWKDFSINAKFRVDFRLLKGLEGVHEKISTFVDDGARLPAVVINRLIGRLLYLFVLMDRGVLPESWLKKHCGSGAPYSDRQQLDIEKFWALQDAIDDVFNGAIFEIPDRECIRQGHLNLAVEVIRFGADVSSGGIQGSLLDINFSALQTETLSAVYEQFLKTESPEASSEEGVVYTPPFLVDFVLNRVEDSGALTSETKIIDPTAGSGVFLVGAFRRIIENSLAKSSERKLGLDVLRNILVTNIFGVEKNLSAAQVAAFSLYLNLVEYCPREDLQIEFSRAKRVRRIFPTLLGENIIVADFFEKNRYFGQVNFDVAVGNPPWQRVDLISDVVERINPSATDRDEAAEEIAWILAERYLKPKSGRFGIVMPSKSFSSPSAKRFAWQFGRAFHVTGLVNLTHWRRHLFQHAKQPAALLFGRSERPNRDSRTWFYNPQLWTQPFDTKGMWVITIDSANVYSLPSSLAFANSNNVFDAYSLKPLDRSVKSRVQQAKASVRPLGDVLSVLGISIGKGGSPAETGLDADQIQGASLNPRRRTRGEDTGKFVRISEDDGIFNKIDVSKCGERFAKKFQGPRLVLPRSMNNCYFLNFPNAVNSTFNIMYFEDDSKFSLKEKAKILEYIGRYLMSRLARYWMALYGRLWQTDRSRLELNDLLSIPAPSRLDVLLAGCNSEDSEPKLSQDFLRDMGLPDLLQPFGDYVENRIGFENGVSSDFAISRCTSAPIEYIDTLKSTLAKSLRVDDLRIESGGVSDATIALRLRSSVFDEMYVMDVDRNRLEFQFYDTSSISVDRVTGELVLAKPADRGYFTLERAFSDAVKIINTLVSQ